MINAGLFSSNTNEWATPISLFNELDSEFHFDLDPCATAENAKCKSFYTIEDDGLTQNGGGAESVLQSALWKGNRKMGSQVFGRIQKAKHPGCIAYSGTNGHGIFS